MTISALDLDIFSCCCHDDDDDDDDDDDHYCIAVVNVK